MKQGKKRDSRRKAAADVDMSTRDRATFVVNMFREFPEKAFALKQLVAATGDNSREARYAVREIAEKLVEEGVADRCGRDKYRLAVAQLPRYEGVVDMVSSGAAYVRVEELEKDIFVNPRNTNYALDGDRVEVALQRKAHRAGDNPEGVITAVLERSGKRYVGVAEVTRSAIFVHPDSRKLPMDIYFSRREGMKVNDGDKVVFRIDEWREGDKSPRGVLLDVLGRTGDNDTEIDRKSVV